MNDKVKCSMCKQMVEGKDAVLRRTEYSGSFIICDGCIKWLAE